MHSVKSQSKASGTTSRNGTFQKGENISGELTFGGLMPLVSPGMPSPILEPSQPVPFKGVTHSVTDNGEVTGILLLTEVNPPTDDPMAVRPPTIITLSNLESYTFSTYHETHHRNEVKSHKTFLQTAQSLKLQGKPDWSEKIDQYLYRETLAEQ